MIKIEPLQNTRINLQRSRRAFEQQHNLYQRTRVQPQVERRYTTTLPDTSTVKSSTPLSSRGMQIPHEIKQYCNREGIDLKPTIFDCIGQYFWMAIDNTIFLWRYKYIHIWGKNPSEPQVLLIVTFPQLIKAAQIGDIIGYQFNSLNSIKIFAIALTNKIVFFNYSVEKQTFQNMKIQVITNNEIVTNMVFVDGRIFYCGSHGTLKTIFNKPRFLMKQTKFTMKSSSWLKDTLNNSILFWRINYISSQLTIIRNKAYFILEKHYPNSKIAMNVLFRGRKQIERTIKVFNINTNILLREIQEHLLLERVRLHCGRSKQLMQGIRIIGLFENNGKLGLSLSCGAFAFLNLEGLLVEQVQFIPLVQTRGVIGQQVNFELDVMQTISSLGFNNLSIFNKCGVAFSSKNTIDIYPNMNISFDLFKIKQLKPTNNKFSGTIFAQQQQWLCLGYSGITQLKRLRLQDIVLVYLQIMSEQRVFRKNYLADQPFLHLYYLFGGINVCVALMQIICNSDIQVQISHDIYQKTKLQIFRFQSYFVKKQYPNSQQLSQNITIVVNENIIKIAAEILSYIESRDLNSEIDILWKSILKYFNEIYELIKYLTPSECISEFKLIEFVKNKLECFKRLLHIKSLELNPHQVNRSDSQSLSFMTTQKNNIPPIQMSLRQKYDTNTPILITRTKQLIDKIYCLLQVSTMLKLESRGDLNDEPTIHNILTDSVARDILRFRILKDIDSTNVVLFKLTKAFPELLNTSDQIFNEHILNTKNNQIHTNFSVDSLVPALKTQRIPIFKFYFYNRKQIYEYLTLLLQRMKYLQVEKHKLKQKDNKYYPFAEYDTKQKQQQIKQLQQNWLQVVDNYEQSLRNYIRQVGKSQIINRLQLLLHYVRSLQIEPITSFTQQILQEQALPQMIKILKQRNDKVELKPKTLFQF